MMRIRLGHSSVDASADVTPAEHVIDKFGGLTKLARALECAVSTVQGWKERGRIPQEHWLPIITVGKAQDIELCLQDFLPAPASEDAA
jgi:hypothetical protein